MKPKDVIKQIITNDPSGWDENDTMSFQFYDAEVNGVVYSAVGIDFENGFVECYDEDGKVIKKFSIKTTLEEFE